MTDRNQSFDAVAKGYAFTFQAPEMESSEDEVEQSGGQQIFSPSNKAPHTHPVTPTSHPATPPQASSSKKTLTPVTATSRPATPPQASSSKRTLTPESLPRADPKKPKLKRIVSAIRNALDIEKDTGDLGEESKSSLLRFFSKGTANDKKAYFAREDERAANTRSVDDHDAKIQAMDKEDHKRVLGRLRQQKRRQLLKDQEIRAGVRSPQGTK